MPAPPLFLGKAETIRYLGVAELIPAVTTALIAISTNAVSCPDRIAAVTPHGLLGAMPGYVPGLGLAAKLTTVYASPQTGRSSHQGVVVLFDETTGAVRTVMDAEPITAIRTAAVATVALRALAPEHVETIAVIGRGAQAQAQIRFLLADTASEHATPRILVGVRDMDTRIGAFDDRVEMTPIEYAVRHADVVMCCTAADEPVIRHAWLRPGTHVSSVGGSAGPEVDAETIGAAAVFVEWAGAARARPPAGAHELQGDDPARVTLLGDVLRGAHPGRRGRRDLTVFKSTGHAALDVAAAHVVDARARADGR